MSPEIKAFFEPKSIVLLGASELKGDDSFLSTCFKLTVDNVSKFRKGKVHIVDLSGKLEGSEKNLNKIPRDRDLAVVLLPKEHLTKNLPKLLARRVRTMVLASGELDDDQREKLSSLAKSKRLLLLGPNATMGVVNTANGLLAAPERGQMPKRGHIAVISQDFSVAAAILDRARFYNTGISKFVCTGEGRGVDEADLLSYFAQDKETTAICVYIESVRDGRRFVEVIKEVVGKKPVIVLKGGPKEGVFEAALKQAGALEANSIDELVSVAEGLVTQPPMHGNRVAVVTNFIGLATLAAGHLSGEGLEIAAPSGKSVEKIKKKYPSVKIERFVDLRPAAKADRYKFVIEQLLSDEGVDGIMVISAIKSGLLDLGDLREIAEASKKSKDKPVINSVTCDEDYTIAREILTDAELFICDRLRYTVRALKMLSLRGKTLAEKQVK